MGEPENFAGCIIKRDLNKIAFNVYQPDLITKMTHEFNEDMKSLITFNTPDIAYKVIVHSQKTDTKISYNLHKRYRSGVRSLLYIVTHSRPVMSNAVRELAKCMYKANMRHYKDLLRAIKYVIDTKYYLFQMKLDRNLNGPWELRGYSDIDYARDNDIQKKVPGYIVLINRVVISWRSRIHKTVALTIKEA